ncbi:RmlC-like cupin domain and Cysteamine dioxygenase family and RmlC-like jelly roll fold domain-containing protein [Strongyloides ratti]|uniref:RmlC-like cupin domain and Cysteamine dioxygenase family and RmlC-like jelly roll fold domain-containing protein n=1 Tax=Strongyloides ratti TaxID=34506 RepID=A0A090KTW4_STRRB|nr:RmlC-like cupin domain and Cysteamine dioxygenase family and RmlC-like jelly roll fold domain-containing protein [Strongyloides ratti]CEF60965.1 RmlC-like cupin domain and Cysteamine dioxygenase family and RmlC-like jelly roll fold domain-containing protein [Strongyloides ratti]
MSEKLIKILQECEKLSSQGLFTHIIPLLKDITIFDILQDNPIPTTKNFPNLENWYYINVKNSSISESSCFGFKKKNLDFPLHDHKGMHGFMKIINGTIKVTSYSLMTPDMLNNVNKPLEDDIPVIFEDETILSTSDSSINNVLHLEPRINNIHTIKSLEDNSLFFDFLVPGYINIDSKYFKLSNDSPGIVKKGDIIFLKEIPRPVDFIMTGFKI